MAECTGTNTSLMFKVTREAPELVRPIGPTPYEFKQLSDIDNQRGNRFHIPVIFFYGNDEHTGGVALRGKNPATMIKDAIAKALVPYYPLAGRLREGGGGKLVVECNGEGILFIQADADVTLEDFGEPLHPPFPCFQKLLCDVPGTGGMLDCPLLLIQVTRLKCGGFALAISHNHCMEDGIGLVQFLKGVTELARGAETLTVKPVWERHLLAARVPPQVTCIHHEYNEIKDIDEVSKTIQLDTVVHKTFFYGPNEIAALRRHLPPHSMSSSTTFEILTAFRWRSQTIAIGLNPDETVQVLFAVDARSKFNPPLPTGYYGNVIANPLARTTAGELASNSLLYAVELIQMAKAKVTEEYIRSVADLMVIDGDRLELAKLNTFHVSDLTKIGFDKLDFGWGLPLYAGVVAYIDDNDQPGFRSNVWAMKNFMGENGIMDYVCLPAKSMDRYVKELNKVFVDLSNHQNYVNISSSL